MSPRRPALIFDFGNVVAFFDYRLACGRLGQPLGLSGEEFLELARERGLTPVVQRYERGDLSSEEFYQAVREFMNLSISYEAFADAWADIFRLNEPVADVVRALKNLGYPLILGSNTNAIHANHFRERFADTFSSFDQLVLSYEIRQIKPSKEFYLICAEAAGTRPAECVFIDDIPENVAGARDAGLNAIQYVETPQLIEDLRMSGVDVRERPSFSSEQHRGA